MDYTKFLFSAVVDWIEITFTTSTPIQAWRIQEHSAGGFSYVHGFDLVTGERLAKNRANTPTTLFVARIQAPERFDSIMTILERPAIAARLDRTQPVRVVGMETSFDARPRPGTTHDELAEMTARFYWELTEFVAPTQRLYHERKHSVIPVPNQRQLIQRFLEGHTLGVGDQNDDYYQRAYFKRNDGGQQLPDSEHRARIEIRLQGQAMPVITLRDLQGFDFAKLNDFFRFRRPRDDLDAATSHLVEQSIQIGQRGRFNAITGKVAPINRKGGGTREFSKVTRADVTLNGQARQQLRNLTKRWKSVPRARAKTIACGNTGNLGLPADNKGGFAIPAALNPQARLGTGLVAGSRDVADANKCVLPGCASKDLLVHTPTRHQHTHPLPLPTTLSTKH